jgi:hypothetical protein
LFLATFSGRQVPAQSQRGKPQPNFHHEGLSAAEPQPKLDHFELAHRRRGRGENFSSISFLRDLCASARELGGRKMLLKKQNFSGQQDVEHEEKTFGCSDALLQKLCALRALRGEKVSRK